MPLSLTLLGDLSATVDTPEGTRSLGRGKPVALVAYLSACPGRRASRERLATLLWAEGSSESARQNLRQAIWYVKRRLGDWIVASDDFLSLVPEVVSDRDEFLRAVRDQQLPEAISRYVGEFVPEFAAPGAAEFEQWADVERRRLRTLFVGCCDTLARQELTSGRAASAAALARRARDAAPLDLTAWRLLLECLIASRDVMACLSEAEHLEATASANELELDDATRAALRAAKGASRSVGAGSGDRAANGGHAPASLAAVPSLAAAHADDGRSLAPDLIGRENEFRALLYRWELAKDGAGGAVIVSGVAGIGKSRLIADFHARLRASRARAAMIRANPGDRAVENGFLAALADVVARRPGAAAISSQSAGVLVALAPALASVFPGASPDGATGEDAVRRRTGALLDLLRAVSEESAFALLVDDIHWSDRESQRVLDAITARLDGGRALVVLATRPPVDALAGFLALPRIELPVFDVQRTAEFLTRLGELPREAWAGALPDQLVVATRGVPLNIIEALQRLIEERVLQLEHTRWQSAAPSRIPELLRDGLIVEARLRSLAPAARETLLHLAIVGRPMPAEPLAALVELEQRGFIARANGAVIVAHDEIAAAAVGSASADERRAAHARAAHSLLAGTPGDAEFRLAAAHASAAHDIAQLGDVAERFVRTRRAHGHAASVREMLRDLLGEPDAVAHWPALRARFAWHSRPSRVVRRLAAAVLILATSAAAWASWYEAPPPALEIFIVPEGSAHQLLRVAIPEGESEWESGDPIEARFVEPTPTQAALLAGRGALFRPIGNRPGLVGGAFFGTDGGYELTEVNGADSIVRPSPYGGDDGPGSPSPDGRYVAFPTARFHPATDRSNIGILDRTTGVVRRLVVSDEVDATPQWSPDGTRIAFRRNYFTQRRRPDICVASVDGVDLQCFASDGAIANGVVGWTDPLHILTVVENGDVRILDVRTGQFTPYLRAPQSGVFLLADARTIIGLPAERGERTRGLVLTRHLGREVNRPIELNGRPVLGHVLFSTAPAPRGRIVDSVGVELPAQGVAVDAPFTLRPEAFDAAGRRVDGLPPRVRSLDPAVAVVRDRVLQPRRVGEARLELNAGGWRVDTVTVSLVPSTAVQVLREDWGDGWEARWRTFGAPRPFVRAAAGRRSLHPNGDGKFSSGTYLHRPIDLARGLSVEVEYSLPLTAFQWQSLTVAVAMSVDWDAIAAWDHRTGWMPGVDRVACSASIPNGEGGANATRLGVHTDGSAGGSAEGDPAWTSGQWQRLRIQLFPDGRCGLAINGRPIVVSASPQPLTGQAAFFLTGHSVGTTAQLGRLEIWEGVRGGVDWEALRTP